jgi:hypothetical protein
MVGGVTNACRGSSPPVIRSARGLWIFRALTQEGFTTIPLAQQIAIFEFDFINHWRSLRSQPIKHSPVWLWNCDLVFRTNNSGRVGKRYPVRCVKPTVLLHCVGDRLRRPGKHDACSDFSEVEPAQDLELKSGTKIQPVDIVGRSWYWKPQVIGRNSKVCSPLQES